MQASHGGTPVIRLVTPSDLQTFRDLRLDALRSNPEAFSARYADSAAQPDEFWLERIRQGAGGSSGAIYVADTGAEFAGMAGIRRDEGAKVRHSAMIWGVYVRASMRGLRIADALLAACLAWAEAEAIRIVRLSVVSTNASALRLYVRHGFAVYGVDPEAHDIGGTFYDGLLLARRLPLVEPS
jgi:ribosomal protein S18 acetylase RimI-like enzyme